MSPFNYGLFHWIKKKWTRKTFAQIVQSHLVTAIRLRQCWEKCWNIWETSRISAQSGRTWIFPFHSWTIAFHFKVFPQHTKDSESLELELPVACSLLAPQTHQVRFARREAGELNNKFIERSATELPGKSFRTQNVAKWEKAQHS